MVLGKPDLVDGGRSQNKFLVYLPFVLLGWLDFEVQWEKVA